MKKSSIQIFLILFIFFELLLSCRTKRELKEQLKDYPVEMLFEKLRENEFQYEILSLRYNMEVKIDKKEHAFKGNMVIKRDSAIWLSINALGGIELFRVLLTTDSLKIINRTQNEYYLGKLLDLIVFLQITPDFSILQSLLTGNDFAFYETHVFKASLDNNYYKLSTPGRRKIQKHGLSPADTTVYIQDIWIHPKNFKIAQNQIKEKNHQKLKITCAYSNFETVENQVFPLSIRCNIQSDKPITLSVTYSKIQLNKPFQFTMNIPEHYKKMTW